MVPISISICCPSWSGLCRITGDKKLYSLGEGRPAIPYTHSLATHHIVLKVFLEVGTMHALLQVWDISAGLYDFSKTRESRYTTTATSSLRTLAPDGCSLSLISSQLLSCCCPKMMTASARLRCKVKHGWMHTIRNCPWFPLSFYFLVLQGKGTSLAVTYEDGVSWSGLLRNRTRSHAKQLLRAGEREPWYLAEEEECWRKQCPLLQALFVMWRDYSLIKRGDRSLPAGWRQHTCALAPGGAGSGCLLAAGGCFWSCFCGNKCWISKWDVCENNNTQILIYWLPELFLWLQAVCLQPHA